MVQLAGRLRELGQMPLYPPNVKGWDGGRAWIDSSKLLGRANLIRAIAESPESRFGGQSLEQYLERQGVKSPPAAVDFLSELLLAIPPTPEVRTQLIQAMGDGMQPRSARQVLHVLGSLPEFQLA
jgi:hypothetical protein